MAVGLGLAIGALVVGVIAAIMFRPSVEGQDMSPATLESFQITTTDEGSVVPWICGDVRLKTNLLWYGDLRSQAIKQEAGGKGGGGGEVTTGFMYWMDLWKSICLGGGIYGNISIQALYVGDRPVDIGTITYVFNDGTQGTYPTEPGQYANAMNGVAHVWLPQYYLGENVSFVPTFHWVMRCTSNAPLTNANLSNGVNPAARIYDILRAAGSNAADFNVASFQTAATYWYNQGYGINMSYSSQKEARERVAEVFTYVDGCLRKDDENKWYLQAYDPTDASVATFNKEDMVDFSITRRSWSETYNDFRANFTDASQAYTRRTVRVYNGANQRLLGYKKQRTVDLTAFRDAATASKRLAEIMRRESYPEAQISFSADLSFEKECHVGKVITVNHSEYGISSAGFRITNREVNEYDSNLLDFHAVQVVETLWDDTYETGGAAGWVQPSFWDVDPPLAAAIFEMPYNNHFTSNVVFLALCARANQEDSFSVIGSANGTDYLTVDTLTGFSQHGTLDEAYPDSLDTDYIDDSVGILYTPTNENPVFESVDRAALFYATRFAVIDLKECVAFQTVTYEGANSIRLTGVIRGLWNTPISSHNAGKSIWLVPGGEGLNILPGWGIPTNGYVKYLPRLGSKVVDAADVTAIPYTREYKAGQEQTMVKTIRAVRTGSDVVVDIHSFNAINQQGAGIDPADNSWDPSYQLLGEAEGGTYPWYIRINGGSIQEKWGTIWTITQAGSFTLKIWMSWEVENDHAQTITVGASDGTYTGETIVV